MDKALLCKPSDPFRALEPMEIKLKCKYNVTEGMLGPARWLSGERG